MNDKYILDGHTPVVEPNLIKWANWMGTADRAVAKTNIGEVRVSTVFLGLDHGFGGGKPLLFETMVFNGVMDGYMRRYSNWQDSEKGHQEIVKLVREKEDG